MSIGSDFENWRRKITYILMKTTIDRERETHVRNIYKNRSADNDVDAA